MRFVKRSLVNGHHNRALIIEKRTSQFEHRSKVASEAKAKAKSQKVKAKAVINYITHPTQQQQNTTSYDNLSSTPSID
ncbi:hypothetical protein Csa_014166 [Cucumis sativus]|uniref:Uncharacterized protein n=1 Tax=Cucumis sativus TaxID=3659 RepID=A0A0A0LVW8_CUCSA|nr:hypothetical protein Csa_014166 [Cucumis sativus]